MKYEYLGELDYDGSQLHHAFAYESANILGPSIVCFVGAASVKEHLVDLEDSISDDFIESEKMLHFIIEIPNASIRETVVWQRYFIRLISDKLHSFLTNEKIIVDGDDILIGEKKLSVSIATLSHFSGLIHVGLNIRVGQNCPVAAIGLEGVSRIYPPIYFGKELIQKFAEEYDDIVNASYKVVGR